MKKHFCIIISIAFAILTLKNIKAQKSKGQNFLSCFKNCFEDRVQTIISEQKLKESCLLECSKISIDKIPIISDLFGLNKIKENHTKNRNDKFQNYINNKNQIKNHKNNKNRIENEKKEIVNKRKEIQNKFQNEKIKNKNDKVIGSNKDKSNALYGISTDFENKIETNEQKKNIVNGTDLTKKVRTNKQEKNIVNGTATDLTKKVRTNEQEKNIANGTDLTKKVETDNPNALYGMSTDLDNKIETNEDKKNNAYNLTQDLAKKIESSTDDKIKKDELRRYLNLEYLKIDNLIKDKQSTKIKDNSITNSTKVTDAEIKIVIKEFLDELKLYINNNLRY